MTLLARLRFVAFPVICAAFVAVLLFAIGCGQKQPNPGVEKRLVYLDSDINLLRDDIRSLRVQLDNSACKCKECTIADSRRLDALLAHASTFSGITAVYFKYAIPDVDFDLDEEAGEAMNDALREAREIVNRNAILFDLNFNKDVDWYYEVFRQMNHLPVTEWAEYRVCIAGLTNSFDGICKDQIGHIDGNEDRGIRMPLPGISYEDRIGMTPRKYLKAVRQEWEKHR